MNDNIDQNFNEDETGSNLPVHIPRQKNPFRRSRTNRIFLGLCGGIAKHLNIDAAFVRIIFSISILIGGWGVIAYLVASLMIPAETFKDEYPDREKRRNSKANTKLLVGSVLLLTGFFFTFNIYGIINYFSFVGIPPEIFGSLTLIFAGVYMFNKRDSIIIETSEVTRLTRSANNRRLVGFCGGLAKYLNTDSNLVRMIWLIFTFSTLGLGFILYIIMWILIPAEMNNND